MKAVDINSSTYIGLNEENNKEDPKFEVGDHVRILKCKIIFAKGYSSNWSEGVFVIKKDKKAFPWIYLISDLNSEDIVLWKRIANKKLEIV